MLKTKYGVDAYVTLEANQMNMLKMYLKIKVYNGIAT